MENKEFTYELKKESELVFEIVNKETSGYAKQVCGNYVLVDYVTNKNYADLVGLYNIMKKYPNLTNEKIEFFIKGKQSFIFLGKFISMVPNALMNLREKGPLKMAQEFSRACEIKKRKREKYKVKPKTNTVEYII